MKDTEKVTEAMLATVVSACEKYRMIEAEVQKAKAELHEHEKAEAEAVFPKENTDLVSYFPVTTTPEPKKTKPENDIPVFTKL